MKKLLLVVVSLLAVFANAAREITPQKPEFVEGCYQISNAEELYYAAHYYLENDTCIKLTADIVVNENVINDGSLNVADTANFAVWRGLPFYEFAGVFDGQGHTISGLYNNDSTGYEMGLISSVGDHFYNSKDKPQNLVVKDVQRWPL